MSLPETAWAEAASFLSRTGYGGDVLSNLDFRAACIDYLKLLLRKNEEVNLTGAKDLETLFWKHLVDSLAILVMPDLGITADWGCGGGLPGIPLALVRKHTGVETPVFFVDSVAKKVRAVEEFCQALDLKNTQGFVGRGEDLIRGGTLHSVQSVVMRAVAPADRAWKWVSPEVAHWVFFLGPRQREEWAAVLPRLAQKKMEVRDELAFALPLQLGERCLMRISKRST
jgi:16S rRNA (guanine(527)-N(7))-methyltransferase RsmG